MYARSADGTDVYFETTGDAPTALVFVHGWLGNARWWDAQRDTFAARDRVVALDLGGHGRSTRTRPAWTAEAYADDIVAVARAVGAPRTIVVGHSMAGAYATLAAPRIDGLAALVLVDTLKDLDALPTAAQVAPMLARYRTDYAAVVRETLPAWLFGPRTPPAVAARLTDEFLAVPGDVAADLLAPLYTLDVRAAARAVRVPVRGIASDLSPASREHDRAYFADYDHVILPGLGHYPMLEDPAAFDAALRGWLDAC